MPEPRRVWSEMLKNIL